jgi:hypothetical protein
VEEMKWRRIIIPLILILILATGFYIYSITDRSDNDLQIIAEEMNEKEEKLIIAEKEPSPAEEKKDLSIKTVDDIHRIYNRVETVQLMNGRELTGAVISTTSDEYQIVTVRGIMKIPMSEVKSRIIIR